MRPRFVAARVRRLALGGVVWALGLVVGPRPASAFECTVIDDRAFISIHWPMRHVRFGIQAPGPRTMDGRLAEELIREAFSRWTRPRCTDMTFEFAGIQEAGTDPRQVSQVLFLQQNWPHDEAVVALTTMTFVKADGEIRFGMLEVNEDLFSFADAGAGEGTCLDNLAYDLGAVITHEVGHFIGLAHTSPDLITGTDSDPTMTAVVKECDPAFRTLETDDLDAVCFVYPRGEVARTCPSLPDQPEAYVENRAFGCQHHLASTDAQAVWALFLPLLLARKRARTCSSTRALL